MGPNGLSEKVELGDWAGGLVSEETLNWERYVKKGPGREGVTVGYFIPNSLYCSVR
jgi:hypothetical protein